MTSDNIRCTQPEINLFTDNHRSAHFPFIVTSWSSWSRSFFKPFLAAPSVYWSSRATASSVAIAAPLTCEKLDDGCGERELHRRSSVTIASASASRLLQHNQLTTYPPVIIITHNVHYSVSQKNPPPRFFLTFFPKQLGIFSPNFTRLLYVPIYAGLQIFIQLLATTIICSKCPSVETHTGW